MLIRLKGVQRVRSKGRIYHYHRPTKTRIKAEYGTPAFVEEVNRLNSAETDALPAKSLGRLIEAYKKSDAYKDLAPITRRDYDNALFRFTAIRPRLLSDITPPFLIRLRDNIQAGRRAKNYAIQALSVVFSWGVLRGWMDTNPAKGIPLIKRDKHAPPANRPWKAHEVRAVMEAAPPNIRLAVALGYYAGLRQGDVLTLPWSAYDGVTIGYRQHKTGAELRVPVQKGLKRLLDAAKKTKKSPIIIVGERGKPYTSNGFRALFFRVIRTLKAEGKIGSGLTFHGLRHTLATALAESGSDTRSIADVLGHATEAMSAHYSRHANRTARAAEALARLEQKRKRVEKPAVKPATTKKQRAGAK